MSNPQAERLREKIIVLEKMLDDAESRASRWKQVAEKLARNNWDKDHPIGGTESGEPE